METVGGTAWNRSEQKRYKFPKTSPVSSPNRQANKKSSFLPKYIAFFDGGSRRRITSILMSVRHSGYIYVNYVFEYVAFFAVIGKNRIFVLHLGKHFGNHPRTSSESAVPPCLLLYARILGGFRKRFYSRKRFSTLSHPSRYRS